MTNYDILKEYEAHQTPVPSYEVYKELIDGRKLLREHIKDITNENAQLKELLAECKTPLEVYNEMFGNKEELLTKIDEVLK
jgi:hypothetical protein